MVRRSSKKTISKHLKVRSRKYKKTKKNKKRLKNKKEQSGGFLPIAALGCAPCAMGMAGNVFAGLGAVGVGAAGVKYYSDKNGKKTLKRDETINIVNNKKVKKVRLTQNNKEITIKKDKKKKIKKKFKSLKKASKFFNQKLKEFRKDT